ncbi:hypothetical protein ACOMHN_022463 [Nucella lapillus]
MIMQKKAERRRRRREEARSASSHYTQEAEDPTLESMPRENAALPPNRPSPKMAAARYPPEPPYHPQQQQHQSSFSAVYGRPTQEVPPAYGHHQARSQMSVARQRSYENIDASANNRHTSAPAATRGPGRPNSGSLRAQYPSATREDRGGGLIVSSSRMMPGQRPISASNPRPKPVYGRKQFSNATNNPSSGLPRAVFGSYAQAYGTIGSSQLASLQARKS